MSVTPSTYHAELITRYPLVHQGKVRDSFAVDAEHLLIVASDRLSAFDVVMAEPIPGKGEILTRISNFWFERTRGIIPNHLSGIALEEVIDDPGLLAVLRHRAVVVRRPATAHHSFHFLLYTCMKHICFFLYKIACFKLKIECMSNFRLFLILFIILVSVSPLHALESEQDTSQDTKNIDQPVLSPLTEIQLKNSPKIVEDYSYNELAVGAVKRHVTLFTEKIKERFSVWLMRSGKYLELMKEILKEKNVPEEIVFLPRIESGFSANAYSSARAAGPLVQCHLRPRALFDVQASDGAIRRLARQVTRIDRLVRVALADHAGRPPKAFDGFPAGDWLLTRAQRWP